MHSIYKLISQRNDHNLMNNCVYIFLSVSLSFHLTVQLVKNCVYYYCTACIFLFFMSLVLFVSLYIGGKMTCGTDSVPHDDLVLVVMMKCNNHTSVTGLISHLPTPDIFLTSLVQGYTLMFKHGGALNPLVC